MKEVEKSDRNIPNVFSFLLSDTCIVKPDIAVTSDVFYAVPSDNDYTYSLLKHREQEHDAEDGSPADGDTSDVKVLICY